MSKIRYGLCCGRKSNSGIPLVVDRARAKLDKQLDIVRVVKSLRKVDLLSRIVMSQPQRYISSTAKNNIVSSNPNDEGDTASEGEDFQWISIASDAQRKTVIVNALKPSQPND